MTNYSCGLYFESGSCRKRKGWTDWADFWHIIYIYYDDANIKKSDKSDVWKWLTGRGGGEILKIIFMAHGTATAFIIYT
jgi:hypothetical protein